LKKTALPKTLSNEAKRWFRQIVAEYGIDDPGGLLFLQTALESFDRMREAQKTISEQGATFTDRFNQVKSHPALVTERDTKSQMLLALKALNLDIEPLKDGPGRPGGR
jgi:P27 family predicted phage terminase small subunit